MRHKVGDGKIAAVVLSGGQARRMGGGDKGMRLLHGRMLLDHVLDRVRPQVAAVALNVNGDPARFARWGLPVVSDATPEPLGPLAGVLAGMHWAAALPTPAALLLSVPTDTPWLPDDLVMRLCAARGPATPIACAASGGRLHPVTALWPVALRDALAAALAAGERGVARFARAHGLAVVEFAADPTDPFVNINDAEELALAERSPR